jgi:hypothetical protein
MTACSGLRWANDRQAPQPLAANVSDHPGEAIYKFLHPSVFTLRRIGAYGSPLQAAWETPGPARVSLRMTGNKWQYFRIMMVCLFGDWHLPHGLSSPPRWGRFFSVMKEAATEAALLRFECIQSFVDRAFCVENSCLPRIREARFGVICVEMDDPFPA